MKTYSTPSEAWAGVVAALANDDPLARSLVWDEVAPREQPTRELIGPQAFRIFSPLRMPLVANGREFRHAITAAEGLSLVGQTSVPEIVVDRVGAFRKFLKSSVFWGAYGPRVAGDIGNVVELLKADPDSRQAVLTIFDSDRDLGRTDQLDLPCTVAIQFLLRRGLLDMLVTMRSNDSWLGLPYDLGQFTMLQAAIAQALGASVGTYTHVAGSMHLYERDLAKAQKTTHAEPAPADVFPWPWYGGSGEIGETASRCRRILLGQTDKVDGMTAFEYWLVEQLWSER
jgi:thymidylate synthase